MNEKDLHHAVIRYVRFQYPKAHIKTDLAGVWMGHGNHRTKGESTFTSSHNGFPDVVIYELSIDGDNTYCGLVMELKRQSPFKKDGALRSGQHLIDQQHWIDHLNSLGFKAMFVWTIDDAMKIIDKYLLQR